MSWCEGEPAYTHWSVDFVVKVVTNKTSLLLEYVPKDRPTNIYWG